MDYRRRLDRLLAERRRHEKNAAAELRALKRLRRHIGAAFKAQRLTQACAQAVQHEAHKQISKVVTRCVRNVGWDYDFALKFERKRGKTECRPVFLRDGHEVGPLAESGGGVVDVAAFALRVACLLLETPKRRRLIVADEAMKNVNGIKYQNRAKAVIEALADELDFQFILATDDSWLHCGEVVKLGD